MLAIEWLVQANLPLEHNLNKIYPANLKRVKESTVHTATASKCSTFRTQDMHGT